MTCISCSGEIDTKRLEALPDTKICISCASLEDVPRITGYMSWEHKTAPTIIIGKDAEVLRQYDRKGVHAQLPFSRKQKEEHEDEAVISISPNLSLTLPSDQIEGITVNLLPSICHPSKPRIGPSGKCEDCALTWYKNHLRSKL